MARWEWITPDNTIVSLNTEPFMLDESFAGYLMPDFKRSEKWLGEYGYLEGLKVETREIFLPLVVKADNLRNALRDAARYFNPRAGDGKLRVTYEDGSARELICRYADGMNGSNREGSVGWQKLGIKLRAMQPYWQDINQTNYLFTLDVPVVFFPMLPLKISKGSIDGSTIIENSGDTNAWISVTINGPTMAILLTNVTTGKTISIPSINMSQSDVLIIDTHPGKKIIRLNDENVFDLLSHDSQLWFLQPGNNHLIIQLSNSTENSSAYISFFQQYLTV